MSKSKTSIRPIFSALFVLFLLLGAAIMISGCDQNVADAPVLETPKAGVTCTQLVKYADALTGALEASYNHNTKLATVQKGAAVLSFVPAVGLVAAGGSVLAGLGRVSTEALRIALDRTRNKLDKLLINDGCLKPAKQNGHP